MIRNYLKIAFRNLLRNKGFTFINLAGLATGIAAAILLFSIVNFELSFDDFHTKAKRIYRVVRTSTTRDGTVENTVGTPLALQDALKQEIPQFEKVVPVYGTVGPQITILGKDKNSNDNSKKYSEDSQGLCAGPEFFEIFDFNWIIGTPKVLAEPNVVVLTKKYAEKYFGKAENAIGQYLKVNNVETTKVVGVLEDIPLNSDLPINILFSYETKRRTPKNWGFGGFDDWGATSSQDELFVLLPENFTAQQANSLLDKFTHKHYDGRKDNDKKTHFLMPLAQMHYDARFENFSNKSISKTKIWGIVLVGFLIVLMACINFINISTALASKRSKEVGIRKTLGSQNGQLINQFMSETMLLVLVSIALGLLLAWGGRPLLGQLFDFPKEVNSLSSPITWIFIVALFLFISLFSGIYPALVLSSFSPLEAFRQKAKNGWVKGLSLRKGLIIFQFSIALMLIVGTIVNFRQMQFVEKMDVGFKKSGIYNFALDTEYKTRYAALKDKLLQIPEISAVSFSSDKPSSDNNWQGSFAFDNSAKDVDFSANFKFVDADYFKTYDLKIIAGSTYLPTDTTKKYVVNETLLKKLGIKNPELAIGKTIRLGGMDKFFPIVAVVKDFQVNSAKDNIKPLIMGDFPKYYWQGNIKLSSKNLSEAINKIEKVYNDVFPEVVFSGNFLEESLRKYYKAETQLGLLYRIASFLAIFIACLGLFGLVTFIAEQRTKEIGVRKVLGASTLSIIALLSKDFINLVLISMLIAFPIAYYFTNQWLQSFVFKVQMEWWYFAIAGGLSLLIALLSVSYQATKAALMNPVKSLKTE